ncbi:hypothetical protein R6Q59_004514 [Mikania micrantha]
MMESTSQGPGSDPPVEGKSSTPLIPNAAPDLAVSTATLKDQDIVNTESMQESNSVNRVNTHVHVASTSSFSFNVPPNANINSESPHRQSSSTVMINSPGSLSFPRSPVPDSSGPTFSYKADIVSFHASMVGDSAESEVPKNVSISATSLQPPVPVPGQLARPNSVLQGMTTQVRPPPSPVAVPQEVSSNAANFSYNRNYQLLQKEHSVQSNAAGPNVTSASSVPHSVSQHAYSTLSATASNSNFASPQCRMLPGPPFQPPPGAPRNSVTSGPPGRPPATPVQPNSSPQQPFYPPYASNPPMAGPPQGVWLQPSPVGSLPRPQVLPYPPTFPGPFPLPAQHMPLVLVPPSNAQPPGTSIGVSDNMPHELPPGTYNSKHINTVGVKEESVSGDLLNAWSAHRTETGTIYYYNAVTGQSTYQKPVGFKGEPDKVFAQPTPISWEKCAGTDWSLVTTNDGKRYYYNAKTKLSSWQIPADVTELRKKQESDALKEQSISVQNVTALAEKGSGPLSLNAPAITTGGRDAISPVSSSALDMIKKKLQDSTAPASTESDLNGSIPVDQVGKGPHSENGKEKIKDDKVDGSISNSSSDSDDVDNGPTKEERAIQFKEMLKERGVAPFSKWEKELPKFVFDPRFKAIPSYSARRAIFDHFVRTRAEEERKEKRAAQKAAIEGYKQLLDEAKEDINHNTDYQTFKRNWGHDPRFEALDRKEREALLNERVVPLKRSFEEEARAKRAAAVSSFKSMLKDNKDISLTSRWSKVKDIFRNDPRYKSVKHDDREDIFNEYISELKETGVEAEKAAKAKRDEEEKLKERERALRKRKEREEQEVERVRSKALRKEAIESYQALLVETIKDPQVSWTDAKPKLEKDPQERAANPYLDQSDLEKLFREHIKLLYDRCANEYKALLAEVITTDASTKEYEDGKTVFTSWSTARHLLKDDTRYNKMPRKDRESTWQRHVEDLQRKWKSTVDQDLGKHGDGKAASPIDSRKHLSGYKRNHDRR